MTAAGLSCRLDAALRRVSLPRLGPVGWTRPLLSMAMAEAPEGAREQAVPLEAQTQKRQLSLPPTAREPEEVRARALCREDRLAPPSADRAAAGAQGRGGGKDLGHFLKPAPHTHE